ncbi:hypothetical protein DL93DRAFT_2078036 [Clavulina sp. PMI_390]|nr:hypothetical protein DL93DRAFT_2078036 [Clavulina sp. PMI_390]
MKALLPVSPQTLAILDKPLNAGMTVFPAISSPLPSSRDHSHPREVYLAAQRQKRQLSQPSGPIIVHPRILALEECHYNKFRTFCLNPAGDILAILMDDEIIVLDFVGNHKYSIKIWPIGRNIISKCCPSQFDPFSVERFQFQVEGALLVFMLYVPMCQYILAAENSLSLILIIGVVKRSVCYFYRSALTTVILSSLEQYQ